MLLLLCVHAWATCLMTGLIWFVQIVHYPLFGVIHSDGFSEYEQKHQSLTSLVVGPLMLTEAGTGGVLLFYSEQIQNNQFAILFGISLALLVLIWLTTAFVSMPAHQQLSEGFQQSAHRRLVQTNWIRTIAWTTRSVLCFIPFLA